jgi:hypothetical protein
MKYSLIFAATAAAYDPYGGYGEVKPSSVVVKASTSSKPVGHTTIHPGYGKQPVTVTTQYQPYPTCVSAGYNAKSCDKWGEDTYVSTTIKDCDGNHKVITKTNEPVNVYHTKKTITHSATGKYGSPTSTAGYALPTGAANKNGTEGCWYELYEKIEEVPYNQLGPHALPGYPGSGLYPAGDKKQPVKVKEYKGGKWSEYQHEYKFGVPEDEVKTYEKPGVYTLPAKDLYVDKPVTHPAEATKTAKAGETCTYGGAYVEAKETGYVTGAFGAYETKVVSGKTMTETVVKYTTVYVTSTGKVEIAKPTITVYDHDTEVAYPTAKSYSAGYYHQDAKVITVTKSGEQVTCKYEATPTPKKGGQYPAHETSTPAHDNSYGYKPSATSKKPTGEGNSYPAHPSVPVKSKDNYGSGYEAKSTSKPVAVSSKPYGYGHVESSSAPVKASSTPCSESIKKHVSTPIYSAQYPSVTPSKPVYSEASYGQSKPSSSAPVKASSTPCSESINKHVSTPIYSAQYPSATPSKPVYPEVPYSAVKPSSSALAYPEVPYSAVKPSSTLAYENVYPVATPAKSTPVYENVYPVATPAKSTPVYENVYPVATPAKSTPVYQEKEDVYGAVKASATPVKEGAYGATYKRSRVARALAL